MNARSAALGFMAGLGLLLPALGQAQPSFAKTLQFWNNKDFVDRFMATYGVKSEVEPKISADENDLFKELIPLIQVESQTGDCQADGRDHPREQCRSGVYPRQPLRAVQ